jgi:hypothetical protein
MNIDIIRYGLKWRKNAVRPRQKTKHFFLFVAKKNKRLRLSTQLHLSDIYLDGRNNEVLLSVCLAGTVRIRIIFTFTVLTKYTGLYRNMSFLNPLKR